jgi:hypothetical protein
MASEDTYRDALITQHLLRHTPSTMIGHPGRFMGMFLGLDNRELLPPFFPMLRGEDDLYGSMLPSVISQPFFGHLSFSLLHAPLGVRSTIAPRLLLSGLMIAIISSFPSGTAQLPTDANISRLGQYLTDLGGLAQREFDERLRQLLWNATSSHIAFLEELLRHFAHSPAFWANDLIGQIDAHRRSVTQPTYGIPAELMKRPCDEARGYLRRLIYQFGELLRWWPSIVAKSVELSRKECHLARRL